MIYSPEENMTFIPQNSIGQENEHKNGCRRECGYKWDQDPKSFFIEFILSLEVEKINMVIKKRYDSFIERWKKYFVSTIQANRKLRVFKKRIYECSRRVHSIIAHIMQFKFPRNAI